MKGLAVPTIRTSVLVSPEFYALAKLHHVQFSEALRVGMGILFAERGLADYDNRLTLVRRLSLLREKLEETSQKLEELEKKEVEK